MNDKKFAIKTGGSCVFVPRENVPQKIIDLLETEGQATVLQYAYSKNDELIHVWKRVFYAVGTDVVSRGWEGVNKNCSDYNMDKIM